MIKKAFLLLIAVAVCACATPFKQNQPVTRSPGFIEDQYTQDGQVINKQEMRSWLSNQPATSSTMATSNAWFWASMVFAVVGGYLVGYHLVATEDANSRQTGLLLGGGSIAAMFITTTFSERALAEAVDTYNEGLKHPAPKKTSAAPMLGLTFNF